ncbi:MAG: cystathionine gamma-synthase [Ignavibacteriae bacterium HGW-Ignavibacteriae-4]|jgi:cystathionine gamma-lyase|nr:MAG: cystathionine gamma-synthase [Ignavibacteriae bacterium HGW-Ignavibacteriae-4]
MLNEKYLKKGFNTRSLHVGNYPDPATGAVSPPIFQTSTYAQSSPGVHRGYEYTRTHNPTRSRLEECLAALENAKHCVVTSSGMSAEMLVLMAMPKGSTILCGDDVYGGTYRLFTTVYNDDFNFVFTDTSKTEETLKKIDELKPSLIWIESPTNPLLKLSDIKTIAAKAKEVGAFTAVDNTFMSPYFQNPLNLGADISYHSMSKYINGHSDVVAGAIMLNDDELAQKIHKLQNSIGPSQSPFDSWLVLRGVKTLGIRMKQHEKNAFEIARFLEQHPKVERVVYPGLESHPHHQIAKEQMSGYGGMITFFIKGGLDGARTFLENVDLFVLAESLGGVESLIESPAIMTHASIPKAEREKIGLSDNLIRVSVGIEEVEDLIEDMKHAFDKV